MKQLPCRKVSHYISALTQTLGRSSVAAGVDHALMYLSVLCLALALTSGAKGLALVLAVVAWYATRRVWTHIQRDPSVSREQHEA